MHSFKLKPVAPFRLDLTVWALRRRQDNLVDRWDGRVYRRLFVIDAKAVDAAVVQSGSPDKPELDIETCAELSPATEKALAATLERMLGTEKNLSEFYKLAEKDSMLAQLSQRFLGLKPPRFSTMFEALVNGIACQQITLTLGIQLLNKLATNFGISVKEKNAFAFPRPEDIAGLDIEDIRKLGFSLNKARAFIELARVFTNDDVELEDLESQDDEMVRERLCALRGVGRWTAEYAMLRGLGRIHLFPGDDVGARNKLRRWLKLKKPIGYGDVHDILSKWEPYGGFIYFHLLLDSLAEEGFL